MKGRVTAVQYSANQPCEDTFFAYQFKNTPAFYVGVFDGHAGWQVADQAHRFFHTILEKEIETQDPVSALTQAYEKFDA